MTPPPRLRPFPRASAPRRERLLLQVAIAVGGLVPVGAGLGGAVLGSRFLALGSVGAVPSDVSADSHVRYLSGLLLGLGLAFWAAIPTIERRGERVGLLTLLVAVGGLARLAAIPVQGLPGGPMLFGLGMELVVTPAIWLWQRRVARLYEG